jgi:hypothetical protein
MTIVANRCGPRNASPRFRTLPWHDDHPNKLDLEQRLEADHLARSIDLAVSRLDLSVVYAAYAGTGSDPHPPDRLLAVILFECRRGRHQPAQWARDARECEPVRWLLRGLEVARSCWYAFRDRLAPLMADLNQQVLALALDAEITPATRAAQDGTLVAANASRHKVVSLPTLQKRSLPLAAAIAEDQRQAAAATAATPAADSTSAEVPVAVSPTPTAVVPPATPAAPPPAWLATSAHGRQQQQQRLEQARERLEVLHATNQQKWPSKQKKADAIVVSLSDPETVVGRDKEKVFRPLFNVQVLTDLDSPLVLGYGVFAQHNDSGVLGEMLAQAQQQLGHGLDLVLADGSYGNGADLAAAAAAGVTMYTPVPGDGVAHPKQIPKREFTWLADEQAYVCPQGHRLELEESWREKRVGGSVQVWRYRCAPEHCQGCPLQPRCATKPGSGRSVTRQEHEELIEALRSRMATLEAKALYRLRSQKVELVNGDWKQHRQLRRFSARGLKRVRCEVGLLVLAHNLVTLLTQEKKVQAKKVQADDANSGSERT